MHSEGLGGEEYERASDELAVRIKRVIATTVGEQAGVLRVWRRWNRAGLRHERMTGRLTRAKPGSRAEARVRKRLEALREEIARAVAELGEMLDQIEQRATGKGRLRESRHLDAIDSYENRFKGRDPTRGSD